MPKFRRYQRCKPKLQSRLLNQFDSCVLWGSRRAAIALRDTDKATQKDHQSISAVGRWYAYDIPHAESHRSRYKSSRIGGFHETILLFYYVLSAASTLLLSIF